MFIIIFFRSLFLVKTLFSSAAPILRIGQIMNLNSCVEIYIYSYIYI